MKLLYFFFFVVQLPLSGQVMFKVFTDTLMAFTYSGGDEFNGSELDLKAWKNGIGGRRVLIAQDLAFAPGNVKQDKGLIHFYADRKDTNVVLEQNELDSNYMRKMRMVIPEKKFKVLYTAGAIVSRERYLYGMFELRFKVEEGMGIWPAFWFYGGRQEIDAFELKGEKNNKIHVDVHCPSGCAHGYHKNRFSFASSFGTWVPVKRHLHEGFNIMLLEWTENGLIWYLNGHPIASYRGSMGTPMTVFLNTSVAKTGEGFSPGPDESTKWPNTYSVDYLRIWKPSTGETIQLPVNSEFTTSNIFPSDYVNYPTRKRGVEYHKRKLKRIEGIITIVRPENNKLVLKVLGKLADVKTIIVIKGTHTFQEVTASNGNIEVVIDPRDKNLTLQFKNSCRSFTRPLQLN